MGDSEYFTVRTASTHEVNVLPSDWVRNLTVYSSMDATTKQQEPIKILPDTGRGQHTVCFVYTDGDNVQWLLNDFLTDSRWFGSKNRGKAPIGWTIAPMLSELAPLTMRLIYNRAANTTDGRDYFIAGPSGLGYIYPYFYPDLEGNASLLNSYMEKADLSILNLIDTTFDINSIGPFLRQEHIDAVFYYDFSYYAGLNGRISFFGGKPIIGARYNLWGGFEDPSSLAERINKLPKTPYHENGYTLVPVHNWTHSVDDVLDCIGRLDSTVQVVAPDVFVSLIKKHLMVDQQETKVLELFPNPCQQQLNVYLKRKLKDYSYTIYDIGGKEIQKGILKSNFSSIDVGEIGSGNYWLKIKDIAAIAFSVRR